MGTVHAYAKARGYPTYPRATLAQVFGSFLVSIPALLTPLIIIGGKIFGWFTATESACVAVLYAGFLSLVVYREMDWKGLVAAFGDTGRLAGVTLFCVGTASAFGWLLAFYQIPEFLLAGVKTWGMGPIGVGFFIAGVFLVVGCFLDAIPAIIIVGAILQPLTIGVGMDQVHFAMIGIVSPRLRAGDAALRAVPDDRLLGRRDADRRCAEGHHDHAGADVRRAGADHRLPQHRAGPAEPRLAGVPAVT